MTAYSHDQITRSSSQVFIGTERAACRVGGYPGVLYPFGQVHLAGINYFL